MLSDIGSSKGTRVGAADAKKVRSALLLPGQSIWLGGIIEIVYELASGAGGGKGGSPTLLKKPLRLFHSTIRRSSQRSSAASPDGAARRGLFSLGRRLSHQKFVDEADAADVSLGGV